MSTKYWIYLLIALILVAALYFFFYEKDPAKVAGNQLIERQPEAKGKRTITTTEAQTFANQLEAAMQGFGTNEERINVIIDRLKTGSDIKTVDDAFGIRNKQSLGSWLASDFYLNEFNKRLNAKGIKYAPPIIDLRKWYEF